MPRAYISRKGLHPLSTVRGRKELGTVSTRLMKHFDVWQWAEFVRGLSEGVARSAMEMHLSSRCSGCQRTVDLLRGVAVTAQSEASYEPPEHAIQRAKAIWALYRPETARFPRLLARLVLDSAREPLPAGMRTQDRPSRHVLYEAGSCYLDLQIEHQPASGLMTLIGQLTDREKSAASTAVVPVWLMERKSLVASTLCNRFGEFQLQYEPAPHLRLCVPLRAAGKRLEVPLNRLAPGRPSRPRPVKTARRQLRGKPGGAV